MTVPTGRPSDPSIPSMRALYEACSVKGGRTLPEVAAALGVGAHGISDRLGNMAATGRLRRRATESGRCKWRYIAIKGMTYDQAETRVREQQQARFAKHVAGTEDRLLRDYRPAATPSTVVEWRQVDGRRVKVTRWMAPAQTSEVVPMFSCLAVGRYYEHDSATARRLGGAA